MIYRDLDCNIVAERLLYWADLREPGCIAERNKARIQHLRDHYQLQPDPKPLSEGKQSWTRSSWEEAEERFLAFENDLTKSYAKAQKASINMIGEMIAINATAIRRVAVRLCGPRKTRS